MKKDMYISPQVEVIEMENEGVIATSVEGFPNVPMSATRPNSVSRSNHASSSDLEDMINDILTVGE
ncbi:hypothetical protein [Bacteroides sp.]|uniref:hypothetical protein n=1 Tax=Bacteroides sp. TaxID=29523 RepID=UPI00260604C0|nr:hypothetical protein [Bacteroides sp.]